MKEIGCGLLASPPRYIATGPQTSRITTKLIKIAQCSLLLMVFIGTTITAQSNPPTSVKWSKLLVIYPFVSPCSRMQGDLPLNFKNIPPTPKKNKAKTKVEKRKKVIQQMFRLRFFFFIFFLCTFTTLNNSVQFFKKYLPNPLCNTPPPKNGLDPRLQLIDTCSCELIIFPGLRASVGVPAGYWSPYFGQVFFLMHNLSY